MKNTLEKFWAIVSVNWQRTLTYRFTVIAYRVGEMMEVLVLIVMWTAIYKNAPLIKGFTLPEMLTYVLVGNLFNVAVRNFLTATVSRDIESGDLSMMLVKPISYFKFMMIREIGRDGFATVISTISQLIIIVFFLDRITFNTDPLYLALIAVMMFLAFVSELLLSYLIGLISFWTDEVDGIYLTIERLKKFFSGGYFPLSLLPAALLQTSYFLPFAYSYFVPTLLYLKKISLDVALQGLVVQVVWIGILYYIVAITWKRGIKKYEGVGI